MSASLNVVHVEQFPRAGICELPAQNSSTISCPQAVALPLRFTSGSHGGPFTTTLVPTRTTGAPVAASMNPRPETRTRRGTAVRVLVDPSGDRSFAPTTANAVRRRRTEHIGVSGRRVITSEQASTETQSLASLWTDGLLGALSLRRRYILSVRRVEEGGAHMTHPTKLQRSIAKQGLQHGEPIAADSAPHQSPATPHRRTPTAARTTQDASSSIELYTPY